MGQEKGLPAVRDDVFGVAPLGADGREIGQDGAAASVTGGGATWVEPLICSLRRRE
ncbi:hypothetical protein [Streptomyces sp. NPDC002990]